MTYSGAGRSEGRGSRETPNQIPRRCDDAQLFSGVEKRGDDFVDIAIVGSTAISERVFGSGETGFTATPVADTPPGLQAALSQSTYEAADTTQRRDYLGVLAAVENPMRNTAETAACVACHVSTVVANVAATKWGIDALTLPERYTSTFDLSIAYGKTAETHVTRALGYRYTQPMISQRVVNKRRRRSRRSRNAIRRADESPRSGQADGGTRSTGLCGRGPWGRFSRQEADPTSRAGQPITVSIDTHTAGLCLVA